MTKAEVLALRVLAERIEHAEERPQPIRIYIPPRTLNVNDRSPDRERATIDVMMRAEARALRALADGIEHAEGERQPVGLSVTLGMPTIDEEFFNRERATTDRWKTQPLSTKRQRLDVRRDYHAMHWDSISRGLILSPF